MDGVRGFAYTPLRREDPGVSLEGDEDMLCICVARGRESSRCALRRELVVPSQVLERYGEPAPVPGHSATRTLQGRASGGPGIRQTRCAGARSQDQGPDRRVFSVYPPSVPYEWTHVRERSPDEEWEARNWIDIHSEHTFV